MTADSKYITLRHPFLKNFDDLGIFGGGIKNVAEAATDTVMVSSYPMSGNESIPLIFFAVEVFQKWWNIEIVLFFPWYKAFRIGGILWYLFSQFVFF